LDSLDADSTLAVQRLHGTISLTAYPMCQALKHIQRSKAFGIFAFKGAPRGPMPDPAEWVRA